ncbi:hemin uptake protein HemP [Uliginosibacterium sediminicola]|uniref:Hemin uptake protein HemP n=1 Tax=Uliginosibacterium sediminicola TaxID=2024550 RepID=A0ABU9Z4P5_9RHOO
MNDPRRPPFLDLAVTDLVREQAAAASAASAAEPLPGAAQPLKSNWPVLSSASLMGDSSCVHIEHAGSLYVLRITRSGKLILTK